MVFVFLFVLTFSFLLALPFAAKLSFPKSRCATGASLLFRYNQSPLKAAEANYPELSSSSASERLAPAKTVENAAGLLRVRSMEDWYLVTDVHLRELTPSLVALLHFRGMSLYQLLKEVYPDHDWLPWRFSVRNSVPRGYWLERAMHRKFFDWLFRDMGFTDMSHWFVGVCCSCQLDVFFCFVLCVLVWR